MSVNLNATGFLWGYAFRGGQVEPLSDQTLPGALADETAWVWLHFPLSDQRARAFIDAMAGLPPAARQIIQDVEARIQLQFSGAWAFGVLPDQERDLEGAPLGAGRLQFAAGPRMLITARRHALRIIDEVRRDCDRGVGLSDPPSALVRLIERFVDAAEARLQGVSAQLDHIEDHVLDTAAKLEAVSLGPIRRGLSRDHREFLALRSALHRALIPRAAHEVTALAEPIARLAQEAEDLDREAISLQERANLLHEEIDSRITGATNRSMRALTIISTMLIPPTLIVGAFGMNVAGIPFASSHAGFLTALLLCLAVVGGAWMLLKRMDILS